MTPSVAQQQIAGLSSERGSYIELITGLRDRLKQVGVQISSPSSGFGEVGFRIPKNLFAGNLDGLISELSSLRFMLRAFSEASQGAVEPIVVQEVSSSDPTFYFQLALNTVAVVSRVTHSALKSWKQVEEIRKIREETRRIQIATDLLKLFDDKINSVIDEAIENEVSILSAEVNDARTKELQNHLRLALRSLYARIERGLTIEVKYSVESNTDSKEHTDSRTSDAIASLEKSSPFLVFPEPSLDPILRLPHPNDETKQE